MLFSRLKGELQSHWVCAFFLFWLPETSEIFTRLYAINVD